MDQTTRTLQVRLQVSNKDEFLKPGMNAYLKLNTKSQEMLLIPSQAVIDTGKEQRVITVDDEGKFVPKQIHVLHESQQQYGIGSGLKLAAFPHQRTDVDRQGGRAEDDHETEQGRDDRRHGTLFASQHP